MRALFTFILISVVVHAQPTYSSSDYGTVNDTVYYTQANQLTGDYSLTGANTSWDYSALPASRQQRELFTDPTSTGFSALTWPYLFINSPVDLAIGNGDTTALVGSVTLSRVYDYYEQSSEGLVQRAKSFTVNAGQLPLTVRTVFDDNDTIIKFPLNYLDESSAISEYTAEVVGTFYNRRWQSRTYVANGWGTLSTPFLSNVQALKVQQDITRFDTVAVLGMGIPADTMYLRVYEWYAPTYKRPLMIVSQRRVGMSYVTQSVAYLDEQQCFQPAARFALAPINPEPGDTVRFQNLSTNVDVFEWDFGDPASGSLNTSNEANPSHKYETAGRYSVQLITTNCTLKDTFELPIAYSGHTSKPNHYYRGGYD